MAQLQRTRRVSRGLARMDAFALRLASGQRMTPEVAALARRRGAKWLGTRGPQVAPSSWLLVPGNRDLRRLAELGETVRGTVALRHVVRLRDDGFAPAAPRLSVLTTAAGDAERIREKGYQVLRRWPHVERGLTVGVPPGAHPLSLLDRFLRDCRDVVRAADVELLHPFSSHYTPVGPLYAAQWQWRNQAGADLCIEPAWDLTRGANMRIAAIDFGFDPDSFELSGAVCPLSCGFSEAGAATVREQGPAALQPGPGLSTDDRNHGTKCAMLAAGRPRRGRGLTGAAPEADLMLVKIDGIATSILTLADAIAYTADPHAEAGEGWSFDGADVLLLTITPRKKKSEMSESEIAALDGALETAGRGRTKLGMPVIYGVGDLSSSAGDYFQTAKGVIRVAKHDSQGEPSEVPKDGLVDLLAPGAKVWAWMPGDPGHYSFSGTSPAAACTAGVAALVLSANATLTADQVRRTLVSTARPVNWSYSVPAPRRVSAAAAVNAARYV